MAPAQRLGFERARPSSGQGVVARYLAARAKSVEPPPGLENPDRYCGDLDRQQHSTLLRGAWNESSVQDVARISLERLGHSLQRTQQRAQLSGWAARDCR